MGKETIPAAIFSGVIAFSPLAHADLFSPLAHADLETIIFARRDAFSHGDIYEMHPVVRTSSRLTSTKCSRW